MVVPALVSARGVRSEFLFIISEIANPSLDSLTSSITSILERESLSFVGLLDLLGLDPLVQDLYEGALLKPRPPIFILDILDLMLFKLHF